MIEIDEISNLVTIGTDLKLSDLETMLAKKHFTLGYFVPPHNEYKLEEALSKRMKNLYSTFYGDISDLCVSLSLHAQNQNNFQTFLTPRQAAGPDWKNFILGSKHHLGFIYQATLKIFHKPKHSAYLVVGLAHDIASHALEQECMRTELNPLAFGRFGNMQLSPGLRIDKFPHLLVSLWTGSKDWVTLCRNRLEEILEGRYFFKWLDNKSLQKEAHQLLHETYPLDPWGGRERVRTGTGKVKVELADKLLKAINNG